MPRRRSSSRWPSTPAPIGTLHVERARLPGAARVVVSKPNAGRRATAPAAGADVAIDPAAKDLRAGMREETRGFGADMVKGGGATKVAILDA